MANVHSSILIPMSGGLPEPEIRSFQEPGTGRKKIHTAKWDRCVSKVKAKGGGVNEYAVCTASIPRKEAFRKSSREGS